MNKIQTEINKRTMTATISAIDFYVPELIYDNKYFSKILDTDEHWIAERTGILTRHIAQNEVTSDLIAKAAIRCLSARGLSAEEIDCIIVGTITPDYPFPATSAVVQAKIGAKNAWGFDISAACCGFNYGLILAAKLVESGAVRRVLVCGGDKMSSVTNYQDRRTAILFGDGAGVALVETSENEELGIIDHHNEMDGHGATDVYMPAGGSQQPASAETVANRLHYLTMNGKTVAKEGVKGMVRVANKLLEKNNLAKDEIKWVVPHQANLRMIEALSEQLGIEPGRIMINVNRYGNTSAATIPICLAEWHQAGHLKRGDKLILCSVGAGYTFSSVYLKWSI